MGIQLTKMQFKMKCGLTIENFSERFFSVLLQHAAQTLVRPIHAGLCQGCPSQQSNPDKKNAKPPLRVGL